MTTPDDIAAAVEAAVAHHRAGRLAEAEAGYRAVLAASPDQPRAAHNLATLLLRRGDLDEALGWFEAAVAAEPDGPWRPGYVNGLVRAGRFAEAEQVLAAVPAGAPSRRELEVDLRQRWAFALTEGRDLEGAEAQFLKVVELAPGDANAHADLGALQIRSGKPTLAAEHLQRAVALDPANLVALLNLAAALTLLGRRAEAEAPLARALALAPEDAAVRQKVDALRGAPPPARSPADLAAEAFGLRAVGRYAEALARYDEAVAADPDDPQLRYDRAFTRLSVGDFAGGWDDFEARLRVPTRDGVPERLRAELEPYADRASLRGADLQLVFEQGVGDQIMFASMLPDLAAEAGDLACLCDARLTRLFAHSFPQASFMDVAPRGAGRRKLAAGSLGRLYRTQLEDFPGTPYLRPRPQVRDRWEARLGPKPQGLRIGLSWRGGTAATRANMRSLTPDQLAPLLDLPGCDYVSLQYGDAAAEVEAAGLAGRIRVFPADEIADFEDLAGLVQSLDVVVSVQTTLVHLCGALGAPCLTLVPHRAEWRYGVSGPAMPWYRSVRVLRQPAPGAWGPVLDEARAALMERLG